MNKAVKGDFIGFTYGGVHFSGHGLMRVSDGSRYSTYLLPSINNKSVQIPGKDGSYFFNSSFGNMEFSISVAYDSVTETDMRKIKQLLGDKKPHALWFDENPYKEYIAKVSKPPQFKWICFDESKNIYRDIDGVSREEMTRLYKGEGTISFTCHTPYARSRVNFLDDQVDSVLWGYGRGSGRDYVLTQINARDGGQIFYQEYFDTKKRIPIYIEINELDSSVGYYWTDKGQVTDPDCWDSKNRGPVIGFRDKLGYKIDLTPLTLEFNYNFKEWAEASGLRYRQISNMDKEYNTFFSQTSVIENQQKVFTRAYLYNAGDVDSNIKIYCPVPTESSQSEARKFPGGTFYLYKTEIGKEDITLAKPIGFITLDSFDLKENDDGFIIDSKLKLILGTHTEPIKQGEKATIANQKLTGSYYNKFHKGGDFFKLPPTGENEYLILASSLTSDKMQVEYRHTYY